jgi:hypothetical protein
VIAKYSFQIEFSVRLNWDKPVECRHMSHSFNETEAAGLLVWTYLPRQSSALT